MQWGKVSIIGVGLLGGSLGKALREFKLAETVVGWVRRAASVDECLKEEAVDVATQDVQEAVSGADLVVLCTPIASMKTLVDGILPHLKVGAVVTDVGSVKAQVVRELDGPLAAAGARFVGSHPMAGSESTGVRHSNAKLFLNSECVVTPTSTTDPDALEAVTGLWTSLGGRVIELSPEAHDAMAARGSHLPHLVASILAAHVLERVSDDAGRPLCASGFRDTTRVASGSPVMWRDIVLANREILDAELTAFIDRLEALKSLVESGDESQLEAFLSEAKRVRDQWDEARS